MTDPATMTARPNGSRQPARARALEWPDFESRLAEALSRLPADQYLIVTSAATRGRYGYYVQFAQCGPAGFHAEAVSNDYLPGRAQLSPALERTMLGIGWQSPHRHAKKPQNYERQWPQDTPFQEVAALAVRTLREVYAVERPGDLRYRRFTRECGDPIAEPALGIAAERAREHSPTRPPAPAPGRDDDDEPADVAAQVAQALVATDATTTVDRLGPEMWRVTSNEVELFVRILPEDPAAVRVFGPVIRGASTPELLVALNDLNAGLSFGRALHVNGEVMVAMEVAHPHVSAVVLGAACEAVARMIVHATTSLAGRVGAMAPTTNADGTPALLN